MCGVENREPEKAALELGFTAAAEEEARVVRSLLGRHCPRFRCAGTEARSGKETGYAAGSRQS